MSILEVQHIEKHFGATQVLSDISFSLDQGQALSVIGSSGSGKTTLLRCLNFLERPDRGSITVNGSLIFDASDPKTQMESEFRTRLPKLQPLPPVHGPSECHTGPGAAG